MSLHSVVIEGNPEDRELVKKVLLDLGHEVDDFSDFDFCPVFDKQGMRCTLPYACYDAQIVGQLGPSGRTDLDFIHWQSGCGCKLSTENSAAMSDAWTDEQIQLAEGLGLRLFTKPFLVRHLVDWIYGIMNRH